MLVTFVSEMPNCIFQWTDAWTIDNQLNNDCVVTPLEFNEQFYYNISKDSPYWNPIRNADVVYVYCTRISVPNDKWSWWSLPFKVKEFMRPEAKMIAQIDDDWVPVFHQDWVWWMDNPFEKYNSPKQFFDETGILEVPDMWWTVLDKAPFEKYTTKPVRYVPLPQLGRYQKEISRANTYKNLYGIENMHKQTIGILRHSSRVSSIQHTVSNVLEKIDLPITYFSLEYSGVTPLNTSSKVFSYGHMGRDKYLNILRDDCMVTIDDADSYIGWSRFVMESAISFVPCISSNTAGKILFPDLYTKPKDYKAQIELIKKLLTDNKFYVEQAQKGHDNLLHLMPETLCSRMIELAKEIGAPKTSIDINKICFINILNHFLPFEKIPPRPSDTYSVVYDKMQHKSINQQQWDNLYSKFTHFMSDENTYKAIIREALSYKDKNNSIIRM